MDIAKIHNLLEKEDYLSALVEFTEYENTHDENINQALGIKSNIKYCLSKLGIVTLRAPKVSVIIPVHNVEKYLSRCLESVIHQTLKDIEIIIVDDGSTDNSLNIASAYAQQDNRILVIANQKASGNSGTPRNQAFHCVNGEYIAFVDSDDYIDASMLEDLYNKAIKEHADICTSSGFYKEDEDGRTSAVVNIQNVGFNNKEEKQKFFTSPQFPIIWHRIYKREFLTRNHVRFGEFKVSADVIFSFDAARKTNKIVVVNGIYYHYNFGRPGSTVERRKGEQVLDLFKSYEQIISNCAEELNDYLKFIINKFIGDYFYCKKNMNPEFISKFNAFSSVFIRRYLPLVDERSIISEYSNKTLDLLNNQYSEKYQQDYDAVVNSVSQAAISVVVPTHNVGKYIEKCLDSLLTQKLEDLQIIIIDDGSSDDTLNRILRYTKDRRILIISLSKATGLPGVVRNIGLERCTGKYIGFVDGDDWIDREFFYRFYNAIHHNHDDVIFARAFFREEEQESKKFNLNVKPTELACDQDRIHIIKSSFFSNVWNRIYLANFLKKHHIFFPKMYVSEDLSFSLAVIFFAKSVGVADTQGYHYLYNRHGATTNLRTGIKGLMQIYSFDLFLNYLQNFNLSSDLFRESLMKKQCSFEYTYERILDYNLKKFFLCQYKKLFDTI